MCVSALPARGEPAGSCSPAVASAPFRPVTGLLRARVTLWAKYKPRLLRPLSRHVNLPDRASLLRLRSLVHPVISVLAQTGVRRKTNFLLCGPYKHLSDITDTAFLFGRMEKSQTWVVVMVVQHCDLMPLNPTLKDGPKVNYVMCISPLCTCDSSSKSFVCSLTATFEVFFHDLWA